MSSRIGVFILGFLICFVFLIGIGLFQSTFSDYLFKSDRNKINSSSTTLGAFHKDARQIKWVLPDNPIQIVQVCKGFLPEDFGYQEATPKVFVFLASNDIDPKIITARFRPNERINPGAQEISSVDALELDWNFPENLERKFFRAEHGNIEALSEFDQKNETRRLDNILEEASFLCTQSVVDPFQQELEMEKVQLAILANAKSFVSIEWPEDDSRAEVDILYELNDRIFRTRLPLDLTI
ncbi:MAG: hypothetical protein COV44_04695 [Deltaproteobacteria bacterium CG11_big_fil_rev_8_21_14_0_20_45_16]|nr:MAG: hypothetical protein COV44_04695 [Deltaproteobacteria bacterium CG11_big_fil_rev_8_21_14_0_20_45_16]